MQTIITPEVVEDPYISTWKVHRLSCLELKKIMDKITEIFTAIESARPRCNSGIEALCLLHRSMEKCKSLLQCCSESSKLYLAISGENIILRCERIRYSLESCLSQLKNMVEPTLAAQISEIIDYMRTVAFTLDSSEDKAGKVLLDLLYRDTSASSSADLDENKSFKFAAFQLQITSPIAVNIEKQSIKKLLSVSDSDLAKKKILNYFLYLMSKYRKSIEEQNTERVDNESSGDIVFDSLGDLRLDYVTEAETEDGLDQIEEKFENFKCSSSSDNESNLSILAKLPALPWALRCKAVEDVKNELKDDQGCCCSVSSSYIQPVFKFLKEAHQLGDLEAKMHVVELLLMFLKACRTEVAPLPKDAMYDLFLFLDSEITKEALQILEILSCQQHYDHEIVASGVLLFVLEIIKNPNNKHQNLALRILYNLSSHTDLAHHLINLECIKHLVLLLDYHMLSGYCLKILRNLCTIEESVSHFVENENLIKSIGDLLEVGIDEEQEDALDILLYLCYKREEVREVLMQDSIVLSLVNLSQNGSSRGKLVSVELFRLLNNISDDRSPECSGVDVCEWLSGDSKAKNPCSKSTGLIRRMKLRFRKPER